MESRGKKEGRQGTEEEGKAEEEGTPPRGRRARERHQRRRDLWYDEGYQTKTSKPKKGRHEILYHTARARNVPDLRAAADAGIGLERDNQGGVQGHAPPVRREARAEVRDLEARIPARGHRGSRPGPEGQATTQVRRIRPLQGAGQDQREQREQGNQDAGDEPDGLPLQKARCRREAVAVRRALPHEGGDARTEHPVPVDMVQAHQRRRHRRQVRRDPVPPEQKAERPEAPSRHDGPGAPHARRQARGREEAQPLRALRDGHRRLVDERDRRPARPRRPQRSWSTSRRTKSSRRSRG